MTSKKKRPFAYAVEDFAGYSFAQTKREAEEDARRTARDYGYPVKVTPLYPGVTKVFGGKSK